MLFIKERGIMRFYFYIFMFLVFIACNDTKTDTHTHNTGLEQETWLFNTQYIQTINESSWEKLSINALNNYEDFKLEFSYISTGKPQTCGLYAKGIVAHEADAMQNLKKQKKILMRPNLIPNSPIWITRHAKNAKGNSIQIEIDDIAGFIQACGDAHQYAMGIYNPMQ